MTKCSEFVKARDGGIGRSPTEEAIIDGAGGWLRAEAEMVPEACGCDESKRLRARVAELEAKRDPELREAGATLLRTAVAAPVASGRTPSVLAQLREPKTRMDQPDETPLYIPTAAETVRVVEVATDDTNPKRKRVGDIVEVVMRQVREDDPAWLWLYTTDCGSGTWCRVEPVCQCQCPPHDPDSDCKWLKWIESKRVAPVVDPALPPELFALVATRDEDCAVGEPETTQCHRLDSTGLRCIYDAGHWSACLHALDRRSGVNVEREYEAPEPLLEVGSAEAIAQRLHYEGQRERDIERLTADRDQLSSELDAVKFELGDQHPDLPGTASIADEVARLRTERDTAIAEIELLKVRKEEMLTDHMAVASRFDEEAHQLRASLATVERERDELLKMPSGKYFGMIRRAMGMSWRDCSSWVQAAELVSGTVEQLSTSNTEADRLRSELETAQQRLAEGVEVMNARQAHDREEIARLRGELAKHPEACREMAWEQLSASNAEVERLKVELATEQRDLTQLWCNVTNAWSRFSTDGGGTAEFHSTIRKLAERNPRSIPGQPAPPREIRVGQMWRGIYDRLSREVTAVEANGVSYLRACDDTVHFASFEHFHRDFTFVSDPPTPATVAGEEKP